MIYSCWAKKETWGAVVAKGSGETLFFFFLFLKETATQTGRR